MAVLLDQRVSKSVLLVAEDSEFEQALIRQAVKASGFTPQIHFVQRGEDLLKYLRGEGEFADKTAYPRPDLVLVDLYMPGMDGKAALAEMKSDPALASIPVVVVTSSQWQRDIAEVYASHANSYVSKPFEWEEWVNKLRSLLTYWFGTVALPPKETPTQS